MKKINNKGFMLVETLVVSTFIFSTLLFLYVQFKTINSSYKTTYHYNNVGSLYATNEIKRYILDSSYSEITTAFDNGDALYIDITQCPVQDLTEVNYCKTLFANLNVKKVLFTSQNLAELKEKISLTREFDADLTGYINFIKYDNDEVAYRLIVAFNDNSYATLKLY